MFRSVFQTPGLRRMLRPLVPKVLIMRDGSERGWIVVAGARADVADAIDHRVHLVGGLRVVRRVQREPESPTVNGVPV